VSVPLVIGHAAAAGEAPENTLAGVRQALDANCEAMEVDVQVSSDGVPVLMHDLTVDRTTNGRGAVRELPIRALRALEAGEGERVPTLDEVLALVASRLTVLCELKADPARPSPEEPLVEAVLQLIRRRKALGWTAIHSFDPAVVGLAREREPATTGAAVISAAVDDEGLDRLIAQALRREAQAVSLEHGCVNAEVVAAVRGRGLTLWTWTADTEADWARLIAAGVDGIITNVPHRLRAFLARA
jgi:glycerophosphoryl diester phosphodiesterase